METKDKITKEELTSVLDSYFTALSECVDAEQSLGLAETEYRKSEDDFCRHISTSEHVLNKTYIEEFLFEEVKITVKYRIWEKGKEIGISGQYFEILSFDEKPFEKDTSVKAALIIDLYKKEVTRSTAKDKYNITQNTLRSLKSKVQNTVEKFCGYKPLRYKDTIFKVESVGYYNERRLYIQDADIKQLA